MRTLLLVAIFPLLSSSLCTAQTSTWTGSFSRNWFSAQNWDPMMVPPAGATVVIPPGSPSVQLGNGTEPVLASLTASRTVEVSGRVTVADGYMVDLNFLNTGGSNSPFTVNGTLTLAGPNTTWSGGAFGGSGFIRNDHTVTLTAGAAKIINGPAFLNYGVVDQAGGGLEIREGYFENYYAYELRSFNILPGVQNYGSFNNHADLAKNFGNTTVSIAVPFANYGSITVAAGTLNLTGPVQDLATGSMHVANGGIIRVFASSAPGADAPQLGGSIDGSGDLEISAGRVGFYAPFAADLSFSSPRGFVINTTAGDLPVNLYADITNTGPAQFLFGQLGGDHALINQPGGDLLIGNVGTNGARLINQASIRNLGTVSVRGGFLLSNNTLVDNQPSGTLYLTVGSISQAVGQTTAQVTSAGAIRKGAEATTGSGISAPLSLLSGSRIVVESRELALSGPTSWEGTTTIDLGGGASPSLHLLGPQTVRAGTPVAQGQGTLVIDRLTLLTGNFENRLGPDTSGSAATLQGPLDTGNRTFTNLGLLNFNGAAVSGTSTDGAILNRNRLDCRGGTIAAGHITNAPGALFSVLSGVLSISLASTITNDGTLSFAGGNVTGSGSILNNSLIEKIGTAGGNIDPRLLNSAGTVHVIAGTLNVNNPGDLVAGTLAAGTWLVDPDATLNLPSGISTIAPPTTISCRGASAPWFTGVSTLQGTATLDGPTTMTHPFVIERNATMTLLPGATFTVPTMLVNGSDADDDILSEISQRIVLSLTPPPDPVITTLTLNNHAVLVPGGRNAPGPFRLSGNLVSFSRARLDVELAGLVPITQHDQFIITGSASLAGGIRATSLPGFTPTRGQSFVILTATGPVTGAFSRVDYPGLPAGLAARARVLPHSVELAIVCPADFNADLFVNSQDFFDFLAAFFAAASSADFNHDTFINSQDFFDFLAAFFSGC
ncbi:MAG: GC-type dockerin domain-anchored protein [Phycisphaerales bacterium]